MSSLVQGRQCGPCTACCVQLGIPEIDKAAGARCKHLKLGRPGCAIHASKPASCAHYACAWLQGGLAEGQRPDKLRAIFAVHGSSAGSLLIVNLLHGHDRQTIDPIIQRVAAGRPYAVVLPDGKSAALAVPDGFTVEEEARWVAAFKELDCG